MNRTGRYLIATVSGAFITLLLSATMIGLIKISGTPIAPEAFESVDFIRVERDRQLHLEQPRPEPPPQPVAPPRDVRLDLASPVPARQRQPASGPLTLGLSPGGIQPGSGGTGIGPASLFGDGFGGGVTGGGDYLPIAQVAPQYPRDALQQGIEGWVLVEFTIGTEGQVKNPRIVRSEPPQIFDKSALDAVRRFRFRPRTVAGSPVEVHAVQNRIRFRLERP